MDIVRVGGKGGAREGDVGIDSVVGWGGVFPAWLQSSFSEGVMVIRGLSVELVGEVVIGSNCLVEIVAGLLASKRIPEDSSRTVVFGGAPTSGERTTLLLEASC